MIDGATRTPATRPLHRKNRSRGWWLLIVGLVAVLSGTFTLGHGLRASESASAFQRVLPVTASPAPLRTPVVPPPEPSPPPPALPEETQLRLVGAVPTHGSGTFTYASRRGPVFGTKGPLRRFRVAVEQGSDEDPDDFADRVAAILGDPLSWTGGGRLRLQLVPGTEAADFAVLLATRDTAGRLCLRGGTNIGVDGKPYTSCRTTGRAIINLDRWRLSAE
ncbi:MAG TPA: DUF3152 domain-containing protein, partial [Actinoplanes sp.]